MFGSKALELISPAEHNSDVVRKVDRSQKAGAGIGDTMNNLQFADAGLFDYCIAPDVDLYCTAIGSSVIGLSVRDTKILDGTPNNIVIKRGVVTIGAPYTSLVYSRFGGTFFMKPLQADAISFHCTGINVMKGLELHHGFDGVFYRVLCSTGEPPLKTVRSSTQSS